MSSSAQHSGKVAGGKGKGKGTSAGPGGKGKGKGTSAGPGAEMQALIDDHFQHAISQDITLGPLDPFDGDGTITAVQKDEIFQATGCNVSYRARKIHGKGRKLFVTGPNPGVYLARDMALEMLEESVGRRKPDTRADSAGPVGAAEPQSERTIVGTYRQQRSQAEDAEYWANWKKEQDAWRGWWGQGGWSRSADENWWSSHDWQRGWTRWQWSNEEEEEKAEEEQRRSRPKETQEQARRREELEQEEADKRAMRAGRFGMGSSSSAGPAPTPQPPTQPPTPTPTQPPTPRPSIAPSRKRSRSNKMRPTMLKAKEEEKVKEGVERYRRMIKYEGKTELVAVRKEEIKDERPTARLDQLRGEGEGQGDAMEEGEVEAAEGGEEEEVRGSSSESEEVLAKVHVGKVKSETRAKKD